jgi:hypothetical protein
MKKSLVALSLLAAFATAHAGTVFTVANQAGGLIRFTDQSSECGAAIIETNAVSIVALDHQPMHFLPAARHHRAPDPDRWC